MFNIWTFFYRLFSYTSCRIIVCVHTHTHVYISPCSHFLMCISVSSHMKYSTHSSDDVACN